MRRQPRTALSYSAQQDVKSAAYLTAHKLRDDRWFWFWFQWPYDELVTTLMQLGTKGNFDRQADTQPISRPIATEDH